MERGRERGKDQKRKERKAKERKGREDGRNSRINA